MSPADRGHYSTDVFVRDLKTDRTLLASREFGVRKGTRDAVSPSVSANGRYVSFTGQRHFGLEGGGESGKGLFVRDLRKKTTRKVKGTPGSGGTEYLEGVLAGDGRSIAFQSDAESLLGARTGEDIRRIFLSRLP